MRHLGVLSTEARLNHTRELVVMEIIARCAKLLIRRQLANVIEGMPEPDNARDAPLPHDVLYSRVAEMFTDIFSTHVEYGVSTIWDDITELAKVRYQVHVERDTLTRVHLNGLFINLTSALGLRLKKAADKIDF